MKGFDVARTRLHVGNGKAEWANTPAKEDAVVSMPIDRLGLARQEQGKITWV